MSDRRLYALVPTIAGRLAAVAGNVSWSSAVRADMLVCAILVASGAALLVLAQLVERQADLAPVGELEVVSSLGGGLAGALVLALGWTRVGVSR